jgi:hypothetical protein
MYTKYRSLKSLKYDMDMMHHEHTFHGLIQWKETTFHMAGLVICKGLKGDIEAVDHYIKNLEKLEIALIDKQNEIISEDKMNDLRIMADNVKMLKDYIINNREQIIPIPVPIKQASRRPSRISEASLYSLDRGSR